MAGRIATRAAVRAASCSSHEERPARLRLAQRRVQVEDQSLAPGEPFQTFELPFRMKMRALLPCVPALPRAMSRSATVRSVCSVFEMAVSVFFGLARTF